MIATVLTEHSIRSYYRFYGARHSILQLGNLVDFESEEDNSRFLPRLRHLSHIGFSWQFERNRLAAWHDFIKLFEPHLRDTAELEPFYFNLLLHAAQVWNRQNPKRIVCESYARLLHFEGRMPPMDYCYICEQKLREEIGLMAAFKPAHPECIYAASLSKELFEEYLQTKKTINLDDEMVEQIYSAIMKGL